jgi:DNA-binding NtrC family response regulator
VIHTVLLIEDDDNLRQSIRLMLEAWKLHVIEAANGISGLSLFHAHKPELVITDILMPKLDGIETLREIRAADAQAKVIVISGGGGNKYPDVFTLAEELGAVAALQKPFKRQQLLDTVSNFLSLEFLRSPEST